MLILLTLGVVPLALAWFGDVDVMAVLTKEDGVVEILSAVFYFLSFLISCIAISRNKPTFLPILWAVLSFLFLGEETSWFQRVFNYSVPAIEAVNAQHEFNLHNLTIFQGGALTDSSIEFSTFLKSQNLFRLGFFGYFLVIPSFLYFLPSYKALVTAIGYRQPQPVFTVGLFCIFAFSFMLALFSSPNVKHILAETREMLYAYFILVYVIAYLEPKKNLQPLSSVRN